MGGKQWNELQKEVSVPMAHPGTFETAPKDKRVLINVGISGFYENKISQCMRFPTIWYVRPAKPQISLRIRAV